jgi:Calcineurin-like phosphoesterase/Secretion system C-terminal sorting domain/Cohesin domain
MKEMKKNIVLGILLVICGLLMAVPIYNIQYTEDAGDGTYPSPYDGQNVSISGIVTCNNYSGDKFVLSNPAGGDWNSVLIYHEGNYALGDEVELSGEVIEYWGYTEIQDVNNESLVSSNNALPEALLINTSQLSYSEAYEGVLVTMNNVTITSDPDEWDVYTIDDGSGDCNVNVFCLSLDEYGFEVEAGMQFESITGIVTYSYEEYHLLPRFIDDIVISYDHLAFRIPDMFSDTEELISVPVQLSYAGNDTLFTDFAFTIIYDPTILEYQVVNFGGTLLENSNASVEHNGDTITISSTEATNIASGGEFLILEFYVQQEGVSPLNFLEFQLNGAEFTEINNGSVTCQSVPNNIADELTVIQRPILSVPEIVVAGSDFDIICSAPAETENWQARLNWNDIDLDLPVSNAIYDPDMELWVLNVTTQEAEIDIYTTYDLIVSAAQIEEDRAANAVYLIPEYKEDYYFVHITDTHLPGHTFWGNDPNGFDYSEVDDLRRVINNVNLVRPEFVLLTGDVVNEGELEGYNDRHQYSIAKNLISEFEVPVFITAGNHDIGGWNDTQPPDGSSRLNWHRFFGWEYLENPAAGYSYTQNYSFLYDEVLFLGIESYINYDSYLPSIFGDSSFTNWQMNWISDQLDLSDEVSKVMFYHYDFDEEIYLSSLGVDMALWGHIHSNSGNINSHPYNLATAAACDGNSAFRVIRVTDNELYPQTTFYAQDGIEQEFLYPNSGFYAQNQVLVDNPFNFDFEHSLLVFKMPYAESYQLNQGDVEYIYDNGNCNEVAVRFVLPASSEQLLTIEAINIGNSSTEITPITHLSAYPNPFNPQINLQFSLEAESEVEIYLYNTKGQKVETIYDSLAAEGNQHILWWDKSDRLSSGVYFIMIRTAEYSEIKKVIMMK